MEKLLLEHQPRSADDEFVPRMSHAMLFARNDDGKPLADLQYGNDPLLEYPASYTTVPLAVPVIREYHHVSIVTKGSAMMLR